MTFANQLRDTLECFLDELSGGSSGVVYHPAVRMTENNRPIHAGEGLWRDVKRIGDYRIVGVDEETGQIGFAGLVWVADNAAICAVRLAMQAGAITEVELIRGPSRFPGAKGVDAKTLIAPRATFAASVPAGRRAARPELVATAGSYYDAVNHEQPEIAALDSVGNRVEAGTQITGNPAFAFEFYEGEAGQDLPNFAVWSAKEQFLRGLWNADRVSDVRFPIVDTTRGLVFGFMTYQPWSKRPWVDVEGAGRIGPLGDKDRRICLNAMEVFKIEDGFIREMESVWSIEPAGFRSVWVG